MPKKPLKTHNTWQKRGGAYPRIDLFDEVCIEWNDHRGYRRTIRPPENLIFGTYCTWGLVKEITEDKLVIAAEQDKTSDELPRNLTHEGTIIGKKMVVSILILKRRPQYWREILEGSRSSTR